MIDAVIDISHHNGRPDFSLCHKVGVVGVIHKATQGLKFSDPMYRVNWPKAVGAGLLFGAYHFGVNASGKEQAERFVESVKPDPQTLLALDYEPNKSAQTTMTLDQAREFVETVAALTGRYPGFYSGHLVKEQLGNKPKDQILGQAWLWLAQYSDAPTRIPKTWPSWSMWQYTETGAVPGIGFCDRNKFNGTLEELQTLWGARVLSEVEKLTKPILRLGSKGQEVRILQSKLAIAVDGQFGYGTERAVKRFQVKHGLKEDGIVGPATWGTLG